MPSIGHTTRTVQSEGFTREKADERFLLPRRNLLINGGFDIWQRGTSFTADGFSADRWYFARYSTGMTLEKGVFPANPEVPSGKFYARLTTAATATSSLPFLRTKLENLRLYSGKTLTISFRARADNALTLPALEFVKSYGIGVNASTIETFSITSDVVIGTTWEKYAFTFEVPDDAGKVYDGDDDHFQWRFRFPNDQIFVFDIAQVQLEEGPIATPFERRHIGEELALCQRYYQELELSMRFYASTSGEISTQTLSFLEEMRVLPTVSYGSARAESNVHSGPSIGGNDSTNKSTRMDITSASTGDCYSVGRAAYLDAEL